MAHHSNMAKNPGTSHMDQRGAKLYEIYSSGKSSGGAAGQGGHDASNISNGSGGSQGPQNSFLQNKYQFATYYGQKTYREVAFPEDAPSNTLIRIPGKHTLEGRLW